MLQPRRADSLGGIAVNAARVADNEPFQYTARLFAGELVQHFLEALIEPFENGEFAAAVNGDLFAFRFVSDIVFEIYGVVRIENIRIVNGYVRRETDDAASLKLLFRREIHIRPRFFAVDENVFQRIFRGTVLSLSHYLSRDEREAARTRN